MQITTHTLGETRQFSPLFLDYLANQTALTSFYHNKPTLDGFAKQLKEKSFSPAQRQTLVASLTQQYAQLSDKPDFSVLLQDNTFTVTTGHQLNIFTGPLYFVYKIITTIRLAEELKKAFPSYNFVPIYWMATEDHDFEEINHFNLFGKIYKWQTNQQGAVGAMNPENIVEILNELPEKPPLFEQAYQQPTLADATRYYVHELFGAKGLICLDGQDALLKASFAPILWQELSQQPTELLVNKQAHALEALGYKAQVTPRPINLFYMADGLRERIVEENGNYRVLNTDISFTSDSLQKTLQENPCAFSPNVILRPVYQEYILPNLSYIGGPGELAYWLELKPVFDHFQVPFPILMPRNFAMVVNKASAKRLEKLNLSMTDLWMDEVALRKNFVERNATNSLSLATEQQEVATLFEKLVKKAMQIDKTLEAAVNAERQKVVNSLENLEKRLKKAEERNQETEVSQVVALKHKLFPNGGLQERSENFLNFYLNNLNFLDDVHTAFDPLNFEFYVLWE
jgi:bacillithiol synthase